MVFTNHELVASWLYKHNLDLTVSYDSKGRFNTTNLDIFKSNPEIVTEYLSTLKKHGSVKNAKEAGETNILLYPGKVKKFIENSENIPEDTAKKWDYFTSFGEKDYDIKFNRDKVYNLAFKKAFNEIMLKIVSSSNQNKIS